MAGESRMTARAIDQRHCVSEATIDHSAATTADTEKVFVEVVTVTEM